MQFKVSKAAIVLVLIITCSYVTNSIIISSKTHRRSLTLNM